MSEVDELSRDRDPGLDARHSRESGNPVGGGDGTEVAWVPAFAGMTISSSSCDQQILEHRERAHFAVHGESLAQGVADAGMHRRRRHFHEAP